MRTAPAAAMAALALAAFGCQPADDRTEVTVRTQEERRTPQQDRTAREAANDAGREMRDAASEVGEEMRDAANDAGDAIQAGAQTVDVKSALIANGSIDASNIDVDSNGDLKTVTLKGTVPSQAQLDMALQVARDKAPGWTVVNQLTVSTTPQN